MAKEDAAIRLSIGQPFGPAAQRRQEILSILDRLSPTGQELVLAAARIAARHDGTIFQIGHPAGPPKTANSFPHRG